MTKVTDLEANLEQFKIEQAAINSEATKQWALLQAKIEKNKVEVDQKFAKIMNALKTLQLPTTLPEDTTTMIDTERSGKDFGNLNEFIVASDVEEVAITTPIMVVIGKADLMLGSYGKSIERVSLDPPAGKNLVVSILGFQKRKTRNCRFTMTKVTDLEANLEQFKIEQAAINSEAAKQWALLQATFKKNKVEADRKTDLMLGSEGKSIEKVSLDPPAGNKSVEKENIKSGITCEENCYQPFRRVVEQSDTNLSHTRLVSVHKSKCRTHSKILLIWPM
uniref:Ankyrin repeat-containing protein n=1 Tax=Tanacetum cinerariifolium TaxID=118510 RepID=A0A6L2JEC2_TANCI|nr:ankyrin repeat-containing protein [Tanacetum cinerariifolium]